MLISKEVEVALTPRNIKIYLNKGYKNLEKGMTINVSISDLPPSSGKKLEIKCDYCSSVYEIRYCDYVRTKRDCIEKDACKNCWHKKKADFHQYKLENGHYSTDDKRVYWQFKENVTKELKKYIESNGFIGRSVDNEEENNKWCMITWAIKKNDLNIEELVKELGYNIDDVRKKKPNGYVIPFEELKGKIESFINEHGFFPGQQHLAKDLKIHSSDYQKHGTLVEIRKMLGYEENIHLVDNRGFINKSTFELIVANYLIAQDIPYKREQEPFRKYDDNLKYRSDFTFYMNEKEIHLEVWGGMNVFNSKHGELYDYESVMKIKLDLYKKYNIELISVTPDIFFNSIATTKSKLYDVLKDYLDLPFKKVKDRLVSTYTLHQMSDEDIFNELMKFRRKEGALPSYEELRKNKHDFLYKEILRRYDSLKEFAQKFNMKIAYDLRNKNIPYIEPQQSNAN